MYYLDSPELDELKKQSDALRTLIIWTLIPVGIGVLIWVYLWIKGTVSFWDTPQLVISLSNA